MRDTTKRARPGATATLLARITQTANALSRLGIGKDDVVAYVLPNLPETHFTIWGAEAVGVVAALNPLLEPAALASLIAAVKAKVLVTVGAFPGVDVWPRLRAELSAAATVEHVVLVDMSERLVGSARDRTRHALRSDQAAAPPAPPAPFAEHDFWTLIGSERGETLNCGHAPSPNDRSSMFCTGGTTGAPKIAVRRHQSELANARMVGRFMGDAIGPGKTVFCGLPLFHVNAVLVTGLLPFSQGAHVVVATPQGYRAPGLIEPLLGDRRAPSRELLQRRTHRLRVAVAGADRRARRDDARVRPVRCGAHADRAVAGVRGADGLRDP